MFFGQFKLGSSNARATKAWHEILLSVMDQIRTQGLEHIQSIPAVIPSIVSREIKMDLICDALNLVRIDPRKVEAARRAERCAAQARLMSKQDSKSSSLRAVRQGGPMTRDALAAEQDAAEKR